MSIRFSSAVFAILLGSSVAAQDAVTWKDDVQGWRVAIDRTIENSCFIISSFANEQFLRLQVNAVQEKVQFIIADTAWATLETGEDYEVEVAFDNLESWPKTAQGHRWKDVLPSLVLSFPFADQSTPAFMKDFTDNGSLRLFYDGSEIANLALSGTQKAVESMLECQAEMLQVNKAARSGKDPFAEKAGRI